MCVHARVCVFVSESFYDHFVFCFMLLSFSRYLKCFSELKWCLSIRCLSCYRESSLKESRQTKLFFFLEFSCNAEGFSVLYAHKRVYVNCNNSSNPTKSSTEVSFLWIWVCVCWSILKMLKTEEKRTLYIKILHLFYCVVFFLMMWELINAAFGKACKYSVSHRDMRFTHASPPNTQ